MYEIEGGHKYQEPVSATEAYNRALAIKMRIGIRPIANHVNPVSVGRLPPPCRPVSTSRDWIWLNEEDAPVLPVETVLKAVSEVCGVSIADLRGPRRSLKIAFARKVFYWSARKWCRNASYPRIGRHVGNRDHSTIMSGIESVDANMAKCEAILASVAAKIRTFI